MIVPQARLLFWVVAVVLPFATLAGVYEAAAPISFAVMGIFVLTVLVDALLSFNSLKGISLKLPPITRASKDRAARLELQIGNTTQKGRRFRLGLAFPPEIETDDEIMDVALPAAEWSKLNWSFTGRTRGNYHLTRAYLEGKSPVGFWSFRSPRRFDSEIRIYPNLLTERKNLAALFLNRGGFGIHAQRQVGKGRDFEKLREYIPGDSYDEIHWKATAKRGHPITKVFQLERTQEIYVVIDASRLSGRVTTSTSLTPERAAISLGARPSSSSSFSKEPMSTSRMRNEDEDETTRPTSTLERYITAALVLGLAAERQGDLFGLLTFSDKIESFIRAKNGKTHYHACRDAIYASEPRVVTPDYEELASFIRLRLRRRALLIVLTALDDPVLAESFVRNMNLICRQHLVLVNMIKPRRADPLFTHADVQTNDDIYQELRGHLQWHTLRELQKVLQRRGVDFSLLDNERLSADLVSQYINVKQRQIL